MTLAAIKVSYSIRDGYASAIIQPPSGARTICSPLALRWGRYHNRCKERGPEYPKSKPAQAVLDDLGVRKGATPQTLFVDLSVRPQNLWVELLA